VRVGWALRSLDLIKRTFLHCGISIQPGGTEDHLINIKGVDNSSLDPNGWRRRSLHPNHQVVSEDFDYMTALISAAEELKPNINSVTQKQLQEECVRRGLAKWGSKAELLARLQAYEVREEFATIELTLGTPIPDTPIASPRAFDFPRTIRRIRRKMSSVENSRSKPPFPINSQSIIKSLKSVA
jgi:hypothetical protein